MKRPDAFAGGRGRRWLRVAGMALVVAAGAVGLNLAVAAAQDDGARPLVERGREIYGSECAMCHAEAGRGMPERGIPPLQGVGAASVDFQIRTGRMPLETVEQATVHRPQKLGDDARRALIAYVTSLPGEGPGIPDITGWQQSSTSRGLELYNSNCAACHGATGAGIAVGQEDVAPALYQATPLEVAEAVRVGPGVMPVFGDDVYSQEDLEAVVNWVMELRERGTPGGARVGRAGPVSEGLVAWVLGMGGLGVAMYWLGQQSGDEPALVGDSTDDGAAGGEDGR